jgi:hypothetical protein
MPLIITLLLYEVYIYRVCAWHMNTHE